MYRYESGQQYPRLDALVSLATALGVSLDHLVFGAPLASIPAP